MAANTKSLDLERGSSQYASIVDGSQTGLDLSTDFSMEAWLKLESLPSSYPDDMGIIGKDAGGDRAYLFQINQAANKPRILFFDAAVNLSQFESDDALTAGSYIHLGVAVDISVPSAQFWIDKSPVSGVTTLNSAATSIKNTASIFTLGARNTANDFFDGLADEVAIYNALQDFSVLDNEADKTGRDNLVAYWKLNDDYVDVTANNNDLTASGSPVFSATVPFANYTAVAAVGGNPMSFNSGGFAVG